MKKTVFISSTYKDLKPHREQIWRVLQDFDVDITGMEAFGARRSTPLQTCLDEIDSSDIYIGIISMCYGSIDDITGKSFTQLEYEKAREKGIEILIYLIDENNGEVKTGFIDFGDNYLRLHNLKKILKRNHTIDFFINEIDLGQKIHKRLEKIIPIPGQSIKRPNVIDAKVYRIKLNEENWIVFVGYLNGKPIEIFTGLAEDNEGLLIPRSVTEGKIVMVKEDGYSRFDFQYVNKRGYKTTMEGVSHIFNYQMRTFDKIVNNLLQRNVHMNIVIETLKHMSFEDNKFSNWNEEIIKILKE
jgi:hypothetical protein